MKQRRLWFLAYYVGSVVLIAVLMGQTYWFDSYRLAKKGIATRATVIRTNCAQRSAVTYRFTVDGKSFEGKGTAGFGTPPCDSLKPGDEVQACYLAGSPQANLPGNPAEHLADQTVSIAMVALFVPLVVLFLAFVILRRRDVQKG